MTKPTSLLQIHCQLMLNFGVIFKGTVDPDDILTWRKNGLRKANAWSHGGNIDRVPQKTVCRTSASEWPDLFDTRRVRGEAT